MPISYCAFGCTAAMFYVFSASAARCPAGDVSPVARRQTVTPGTFSDWGVVVDDEAFLILADQSIISETNNMPTNSNLFRCKTGQDPRAILSRSDSIRYLGGKLSYDQHSGRLATVSQQVAGKIGHNPNQIVVFDPSTSPTKIDVVSDNGRLNGSPTFSPDGRWVAFFSSRGDAHFAQHDSTTGGITLHVVELASRHEREISTPSYEMIPVDIPAWSPDSQRLAFAASYLSWPRQRKIYVVRPDGSDLRPLAPADNYSAESVVWPLPDQLLFAQIGMPGIFQVSLTSNKISNFKAGDFMGVMSLSVDRKRVHYNHVDPNTGIMTPVSLNVGAHSLATN